MEAIAARAAQIFAARAGEEWADAADGIRAGPVSAAPLLIDIGRTSDEAAAGDIAAAWLEAVAIHLEIRDAAGDLMRVLEQHQESLLAATQHPRAAADNSGF